MGSTTKTLKLLDLFTSKQAEIGLSEFARLSGYDKATTHRRLNELRESGFLTQDNDSKLYRLGPAIIRLEAVREQTFPLKKCAYSAISNVVERVKETCHVSLIQGQEGLSTLAYIDDTTHGHRVFIEPADMLPFHASASGLAVLAFSENDFLDSILERTLESVTKETVTDPEQLRKLLRAVTRFGHAKSENGLEMDVCGIAVPFFNHSGICAGSVAVATPSSRLTESLEKTIIEELKIAAIRITHDIGGSVPAALNRVWGA